ncbi:MAG: hypothetical protein F6K62_00760 [Sphaerospermopsis sp. SIO1G2]|nr:hypothetical protein [Sphaerospermopsis sp. SIO1G1]NET69624.1 hypothetical protein [Sphaerospermopsis sp. SIO1G2]
MSQDLTQKWLAEIQALKQQMVELQKQRDQAWESSQKWRQLYNTESEQRRIDAKTHQQAIASLKAEMQQLQGINFENINDSDAVLSPPEFPPTSSSEELQAHLVAVTQERDRLIQALKQEQENHEQTRNNLTTALGDAIDSLTKLKARNQ